MMDKPHGLKVSSICQCTPSSPIRLCQLCDAMRVWSPSIICRCRWQRPEVPNFSGKTTASSPSGKAMTLAAWIGLDRLGSAWIGLDRLGSAWIGLAIFANLSWGSRPSWLRIHQCRSPYVPAHHLSSCNAHCESSGGNRSGPVWCWHHEISDAFFKILHRLSALGILQGGKWRIFCSTDSTDEHTCLLELLEGSPGDATNTTKRVKPYSCQEKKYIQYQTQGGRDLVPDLLETSSNMT